MELPPPSSSSSEPTFDNAVDEIAYWRNMAEEYKQGMDEALDELEEFQIKSNELERELETQLQQVEKANSELKLNMEKLTRERDQYREHLESGQTNMSREVMQLQEELTRHRTDVEQKKRYIRELEQTNDDLERSKRTAVVSLEDIETHVHTALERNVILETEKEDLVVAVQRLMDETRDLRQELAVNRKNTLSSGLKPSETCLNGNQNSKETPVQTDVVPFSNTLFTPTTRIAALNMVNDALQKLGHLEFKLTELYRTQGVPPQTAPPFSLTPLSTGQFVLTTGALNSSSALPATTAASNPTQNRYPCTTWTNGHSSLHDHSPVPKDNPVGVQN